MSEDRPNLVGMNRAQLENYFRELGEKPFRATQVLKWLHQIGVADFAQMTNLSKELRVHLSENTVIDLPKIIKDERSSDGTRKWLLQLQCGNSIETVFIPETDRGTLCVSSQVGCALKCTFCATAMQGFNRNLSVAEIVGQIQVANQALGRNPKDKRIITNVVLMGMGEPLLNLENVVKALDIMMEDFAYGLSKRRITLSTSGVIPALDQLSDMVSVNLAVSLHASNDQIRDQIVPLNKKYPIKSLIDACKRYLKKGNGKNRVTIEYIMLDGINDRKEHALELVQVLSGLPAKINLIPFNKFPGSNYQSSSEENLQEFRDVLIKCGFVTVTRRPRGEDINAACGQLAGMFEDRTRRRLMDPISNNQGTACFVQ